VKPRKTGRETRRQADVIPLNAAVNSARNTTPPIDEGYVIAPPLTPPYGWRLAPARSRPGWELIHDREQWGVISWLIQERRAGLSYDTLAADLRRDGVPAPKGGRSAGRWHGERVRGLIRRYAPDLAAPPRAQRGSRLAQLWERDAATLTEEEKAELEDLERAAFESYDAENTE